MTMYHPFTGLWAVTGSGMATFWDAVGQMPPDGVSPLLRCIPLDLPSTHSLEARRYILAELQVLYKSRLSADDELSLLDWSENCAIMDYALAEFIMQSATGAMSMSAFLDVFTLNKLIPEVSITPEHIYNS